MCVRVRETVSVCRMSERVSRVSENVDGWGRKISGKCSQIKKILFNMCALTHAWVS